MADDSERDDPVLVRPYITTQPAGEPTEDGGSGDESAQTWPATADLPEEPTGEQPVVVPTPGPAARTTALRRQRLRLLAVIGVLALLGGTALLLFTPSDQDDSAPVAGPPPTMATLPATPGAAPVASGGARSLAPSSSGPVRSATATATPTATTTAPGAPAPNGNQPPPAAGEPTPTLSPPPGTARTGPVTAAGGRCLARGGFLGIGKTPVVTNGCAEILYQRFTLATDGTLRVTDRCARVAGDGTVDLVECGDQPSAQWRTGPGGSLVNPETGRCLTDPGSAAATVTVTDCTGADNQRWTLP
jgi:hypothetical protein